MGFTPIPINDLVWSNHGVDLIKVLKHLEKLVCHISGFHFYSNFPKAILILAKISFSILQWSRDYLNVGEILYDYFKDLY